jgi:glycosyltransferase involved in cell wall biosynthesis
MGKKIFISVTNDLNQDQRMHRICNSLVDAGHDVSLVGRAKRNSADLLIQRFDQKRLKCFFERGVLFYLEYNIRLLVFLMIRPIDIIYSVDLDTLAAGGLVSILRRKKLIYDAHEYFVEVPELENSILKKRLWNLVARLFISSSDLNITVNKELAEVLKIEYGHEFEVIRSVPLFVERQQVSEKKMIILYQGVLNKGRGLEQAIKWISSSKENIELHIVGEGDLSHRLRALKSEIDLDDKVRFLGWKSPQELDEITKTAWLGLNLLDGSSLNYKYSLANKFFNYMHAGVPSVNMNFPVYRRYCSKYNVGICISDLDPETIGREITSLITDHIKYQEMVRATKTVSKEHSWQEEEVRLIQIINKMMD